MGSNCSRLKKLKNIVTQKKQTRSSGHFVLVANKTEFQDHQWLGFPTNVIKNSEPENNIVQNLLFIEDNKGYIDSRFWSEFLKTCRKQQGRER